MNTSITDGVVLAAGPWGIQWKGKDAVLDRYENPMMFSCRYCGRTVSSDDTFNGEPTHLPNCKHPENK